MTNPVLVLTDGTTRVDMLRIQNGFSVEDWRQAIAQFKGGGVWSQSSLSEGRRLVHTQYDNTQETFPIKVTSGGEQDISAHVLQDFLRLSVKASEYWTTKWQDEPVWIERRAGFETGMGYAIVYTSTVPELDDIFSISFDDDAVLKGMAWIVERDHWKDNPPGEGSCVELSGTDSLGALEESGTSEIYYPLITEDDAHVMPINTLDVTNVNLIFGWNGWNVAAGIRFRKVNIPRNAQILSAFVRVTCSVAAGAVITGINITGEDNGTPAQFSDYADFAARIKTAATVAWAVPVFVQGVQYDTPDISSVIQEIVSRDDWDALGDLVTFFDSTGGFVSTRFTGSTSNLTYDVAELHVTWRVFGRVGTCQNEVYIANKSNRAQLTDVYIDDGGVFGANLIGAALPFNLLPAVPAVNDAIYFRAANPAGTTRPFASLVFDIGTAIVDVTTVVWEYWNGAWVALTVQDNTNADGAMTGVAFDTVGVNSVHWVQPSDWATVNVNGVLGYWVRARVTVIGVAPTAPTQQNRDLYTILWPYVTVDESQVMGDISALARCRLANHSSDAAAIDLSSTRVVIGLRSLSRGVLFVPFINCADEQNVAGVTVSVDGMGTVFANNTCAPSGRVAYFNPGAPLTGYVKISLDSSIAYQYYGTYHVFVRVYLAGATPANVTVRPRVMLGVDTSFTGQYVACATNTIWELIDLGKVDIGSDVPVDPPSRISDIYIEYASSQANPQFTLFDVVLIPVDEWVGDFEAVSGSGLLGDGSVNTLLDVDSISYPKLFISSILRDVFTDYLEAMWKPISSGQFILQSNVNQRLHILTVKESGGQYYSFPEDSNTIVAFCSGRYLALRGAR